MKVFNDPVHHSIRLPDYCVKIIDTPQFQRLRHLKQLDQADLVYPGATHNRFAHSIGVCYLAGEVIRHLDRVQPDLKITSEEIECVQLAGLCHSLGIGPLSHKFEKIVKRLMPKEEIWTQAKGCVDMLIHLDKENNIGLTEEKRNLISDIISGGPPPRPPEEYQQSSQKESKRWKRYRTKRFLYQIVHNKDTGVDVYKWDYLARDCHYLGIQNNFDHLRIIPFMRVCDCDREGEETKEICFPNKLIIDLSAMFRVRWDLHYRAYQHRVVKLIEEMQSEALYEYLANDAKKKPPVFGSMKDVVDNMAIYSTLDDRVFGDIALSKQSPGLEKARDIMKRIDTRDLYQCIGEILDAGNTEKWKDITHDKIKMALTDGGTNLGPKFKECCNEENLMIVDHVFDYVKWDGKTEKSDKNPLKLIYFYNTADNKYDDKNGVRLGDDKMPPTLPSKLQWQDIRLYTRTNKFVIDQSIKDSVTEKIDDGFKQR